MTEQKRLVESDPVDIRVRVKEFRKIYPSITHETVVAVEKMSFGLDYGECFAMLGVNGSGKSTTFKCLTNEYQPTKGQLTINGLNV
jgi:ABC-type multidrug transport system ATPase subunit